MENYKDLKILVVDDLQENLISLKTVLEKNNFIVETAESGKKALDLLLKQDFGLALLDVQMPQMDGFEVAEHMKSNNRTKNIPIVFLSALATQRDFFKKGFEVGAIDYLTKPLDADLLLLKVSNLLMLSYAEKKLKIARDELANHNIRLQISLDNIKLSYESMFYSSPFHIAVINKKGVFVAFNKGEMISGIKTRDLLGTSIASQVFPIKNTNFKTFSDFLDDVFEHKKIPENVQGKIIKSEDAKKYLEISFGWVKSDSGDDLLQIITKDVTERVKEKNLNAKLLDELSRKNNDLMQFSYIVSHNIRAPIAQILGLCYLIKMPNINDSERNKIIDLFSESANNIDALIKDLNNILTAKVPLNENKEKISIPSLLINIKELLKKQIEETKADIQIDIQKNSEEIYTLKRYLESILFNLISNSIKHKSPERNPVIRINVAKKSHTIITISDNGLGIDMKLYGDQVFGLYKRFNLSKEGKGLGLHMTKLQVEAMNGRITLKSKLDVGTVVRIELPK